MHNGQNVIQRNSQQSQIYSYDPPSFQNVWNRIQQAKQGQQSFNFNQVGISQVKLFLYENIICYIFYTGHYAHKKSCSIMGVNYFCTVFATAVLFLHSYIDIMD